jgi:hypothetical protein
MNALAVSWWIVGVLVVAAIVAALVGIMRLRVPLRIVREKAAAFDDMPIVRAIDATSRRVEATAERFAEIGLLSERLLAALASVESALSTARATAVACAAPYRRAAADLSSLRSLFGRRSNGRQTPES